MCVIIFSSKFSMFVSNSKIKLKEVELSYNQNSIFAANVSMH